MVFLRLSDPARLGETAFWPIARNLRALRARCARAFFFVKDSKRFEKFVSPPKEDQTQHKQAQRPDREVGVPDLEIVTASVHAPAAGGNALHLCLT